ncbi:unnamed protein product [Rotaria magnacalcarata]|uniref:Tyrosine-protein kinase ephrin type A/B receptor-like domain-containing protein n=1 Tax=Rotaria magnacalcarata TaxID=392030 RepID=A0A816C5C6_9BILA|nr:unnamed protein product [Rotaria magnacalcarata]
MSSRIILFQNADLLPKPCPPVIYKPPRSLVSSKILPGAIECDLCPIGYQTTSSGQTYCRACSPDHYSPNFILCESGFANDKHGRDKCDLCPNGFYADVPSLTY